VNPLQIDILTAFPKMIGDIAGYSILARSVKQDMVQLVPHDLRDYTDDKHRTIDEPPYGGGGGMILKPEPLFRCIENLFNIPPIQQDDHIKNHLPADTEILLMTPKGEPFTQKFAVELSLKSRLVFICGHYKGIDERVSEKLVTRFVSIGDFISTGGELPAMLMIDAVIRLIPGVLHDSESALTDSFQDGLLDCAYYTRPENFRGMLVPDVLLSGNHMEIKTWREKQKFNLTKQFRPDLIPV
jgi:tRNA (guanine37-N1)-methyltransferase